MPLESKWNDFYKKLNREKTLMTQLWTHWSQVLRFGRWKGKHKDWYVEEKLVGWNFQFWNFLFILQLQKSLLIQ
jgi:hypothetical protein